MMGGDETEIYEFLHREVSAVQAKWALAKQLFSAGPDIDVLNHIAPGAFTVIQWSIYESIVIGIARLTDPRGKRRGQNHFTFLKLIDCTDDVAKNIIKTEVDRHKDKFKPIRDRRDQQQAHSDRGATTISVASRNEIDAAVEALIAIMHVIESTHKLPRQGYEGIPDVIEGGDLIGILRQEYADFKRRVAGSILFQAPNHINIDDQFFEMTALRRDTGKKIVFPDKQTHDEVTEKVYELFGLIAEKNSIDPFNP